MLSEAEVAAFINAFRYVRGIPGTDAHACRAAALCRPEVDAAAENQSSSGMSQPSSIPLPYAHLNLVRNPFGELSTEEWAELAVVETEPLLSSLSTERAAIQFLGDKGYGKTTHLLALKAVCPQAGYVHIPEGETRPMPTGSPLLVDEAQRMTRRQRHAIFPAAVPLVLGTHRDFGRSLRRAGRNVTTIEVAQDSSPERLHRLLNLRIAASRRGPGTVPQVSLPTAADLLDEFGPNIRAIVHQLYERIQAMETAGEM